MRHRRNLTCDGLFVCFTELKCAYFLMARCCVIYLSRRMHGKYKTSAIAYYDIKQRALPSSHHRNLQRASSRRCSVRRASTISSRHAALPAAIVRHLPRIDLRLEIIHPSSQQCASPLPHRRSLS